MTMRSPRVHSIHDEPIDYQPDGLDGPAERPFCAADPQPERRSCVFMRSGTLHKRPFRDGKGVLPRSCRKPRFQGIRFRCRHRPRFPLLFSRNAAEDGDGDGSVGTSGNFPAEYVALEFVCTHLRSFVVVRKRGPINLHRDFAGCRVDAVCAE